MERGPGYKKRTGRSLWTPRFCLEVIRLAWLLGSMANNGRRGELGEAHLQRELLQHERLRVLVVEVGEVHERLAHGLVLRQRLRVLLLQVLLSAAKRTIKHLPALMPLLQD